jgi:hypothetical protein
MADDSLVHARKRAERAVQGMEDGPLKIAAFQTILTKLLAEAVPAERVEAKAPKAGTKTAASPTTLRGRILTLKSEDHFKTQRALSEVREALKSRGWHYPLTTLSGTMQVLVQQGELRRERVAEGGKKVWKYSNP